MSAFCFSTTDGVCDQIRMYVLVRMQREVIAIVNALINSNSFEKRIIVFEFLFIWWLNSAEMKRNKFFR